MTPSQHAHYLECLARGTSHSLAEMFALAQPPMSNTDREFLEGRGGCYDQFKGQAEIADYYGGLARRAGVNPTGKVYLSGLAAFPGDPQAWVSGRGDVRRVCEERGWACEGSVSVKGDVRAPTWEKYEVAQDLVQERAQELVQAGVSRPGEDAQELAREQLSPRKTEAPI